METQPNTMNNMRSLVSIIGISKRIAMLILMTSIVSQAIESDEFKLTPELALTFEMQPNKNLFLIIQNLSDHEISFTSNLSGVLNLKFLGFPIDGMLQYRYSISAVSKSERLSDWQSAARYSSLAYPPELVKESRRMHEFKLSAHEVRSFTINYEQAIDVTTAAIPSDQLVFDKFKIKLPIMVQLNGKEFEKDIVSDWLPCTTLLAKIQKGREIDATIPDANK